MWISGTHAADNPRYVVSEFWRLAQLLFVANRACGLLFMVPNRDYLSPQIKIPRYLSLGFFIFQWYNNSDFMSSEYSFCFGIAPEQTKKKLIKQKP